MVCTCPPASREPVRRAMAGILGSGASENFFNYFLPWTANVQPPLSCWGA
jgi:hypothetical protein